MSSPTTSAVMLDSSASIVTDMEELRVSSPSPFFARLPREIRDQIYLRALGIYAGLGSPGLFRVNKQFHDEVMQALLSSYVFVKVLSAKMSLETAKRITPVMCIKRISGALFQHCNIRINFTDHTCRDSFKSAMVLPGLPAFKEFLERTQLDNYPHPDESTETPLSRLSWLIDMKSQNVLGHDNLALQTRLLRMIGSAWRDFEYVRIINSNLGQEIEQQVKAPRWTSITHYIRHNRETCLLAQSAFNEGNLSLALQHFRPVHYWLGATQGTMSTAAWDMSSQVLRFRQAEALFHLWASSSLASIYLLLIENGDMGLVRASEGLHYQLSYLYTLAQDHARIAVTTSELFARPGFVASPDADSLNRIKAQSYLRLGIALRLEASSLIDKYPQRVAENLKEAQRLIDKALAMGMLSRHAQPGSDNLSFLRFVSQSPIAPHNIEWAKGLEKIASILEALEIKHKGHLFPE